MLNVNLLSGHAHCGTFPLVPCRRAKCLSGPIKFEYRIRLDRQDIMLMMSTDLADGNSVNGICRTLYIYIDKPHWMTTYY